MEFVSLGVAVAAIGFAYLVKAPSPGGAVPGCAGILLGLLIAVGAIVRRMIF
jgi:hypothetical protein